MVSIPGYDRPNSVIGLQMRERQRLTHSCPHCRQLGVQGCLPFTKADSNTPRDGEIVQYYPRNEHPPTEDPGLGKHFVVLLPPRFKHARHSSNPDYQACAVVTSNPISFDIPWHVFESRNVTYCTPPQALFQEEFAEGGVDWEPLWWTLFSSVGVRSRTIHRSCLHTLWEPEWPGIRAKLDHDSLNRLTLAIDDSQRSFGGSTLG